MKTSDGVEPTDVKFTQRRSVLRIDKRVTEWTHRSFQSTEKPQTYAKGQKFADVSFTNVRITNKFCSLHVKGVSLLQYALLVKDFYD